ncbi:unnamed protein product [Ilex paraguariensis]|uniref:Movement protein n=1 Tax=Ilex paraguariensis TaxID=185542 RepID=A0ABC8SCD7_9AQUA
MIKTLFSTKKDSRRTSFNNNEEQEEQVREKLQNWNPPKVKANDVYHKSGIFESKSHYEIKKVQKTLPIRNEYEDFLLIDRNTIQEHEQQYNYLHIGLIQVAVKPLTTKGLNSSVLVCLRDGRCLDFNASQIAMVESSLSNGPIYFNCYPNFPVSLTDRWILDVFSLNIKTHGFERDGSSEDIVIVYKVCYKLVTTVMIDMKAKFSHSNGKTPFIQTNLLRNNVAVSNTTEWASVEIPERWRVINEAHRRPQPSPNI